VKEGVKSAKDKGQSGQSCSIFRNGWRLQWACRRPPPTWWWTPATRWRAPPHTSRKDSPAKMGKEKEVLSEEESEMIARKKKFTQEVKEAKRSTLIFRTNMGSTPVLNPETMKRRFTKNVFTKAVAVEGSGPLRRLLNSWMTHWQW
jgi:hypothetical protein